MNQFFRRLPLLAKLILIGLIPCGFLLYLTVEVYNEKTAKLKLFENYQLYMAESANINGLINALQDERKYSFDYAMMRTMRKELVLQRPRTDAFIQKLQKSNDPSLLGFTQYTRLGELAEMRKKVDFLGGKPDDVMHFYSNTVFRLNTLNTIPPATMPYLQPLFKDLMAQKILSEMITYLGIIRSNIYNVLHTQKYMVETLVGTIGAHDIYNSYEAELLAKATPRILEQYKTLRNTTALKPTVDHIDTLFKRFSFDSSYTAAAWWQVSNEGVNELRDFQNTIWNGLNGNVQRLYQREYNARTQTLVLLILALLSVMLVVSYIVVIISRTLKELRIAAEKISNGETGVQVKAESNDAIGSLAKSISRIDQNNQVLAEATVAIGKGNYNVEVVPRGASDILGNAIVATKKELEQYSQRMEMLVAERTTDLARSNEDLQQFAHVASHDLKEPLRKIATFSNILNSEQKDVLSDKAKVYLQKIETASVRMSQMIEGILTYSTVNANEQEFQRIDLNEVMREVENDLELAILQKEAQVIYHNLPRVSGIKLLLHQVLYNLVNNALKFSRAGTPPVITITAVTAMKEVTARAEFNLKPGNYVQVDIGDNGIGFGSESAESIFGVFSRLNSKDKYEGTGLGLALCRKIVHRHGGAIWAEGDETKGACFHLLLPAPGSMKV
jgi:signal transduction histidine kinase